VYKKEPEKRFFLCILSLDRIIMSPHKIICMYVGKFISRLKMHRIKSAFQVLSYTPVCPTYFFDIYIS